MSPHRPENVSVLRSVSTGSLKLLIRARFTPAKNLNFMTPGRKIKQLFLTSCFDLETKATNFPPKAKQLWTPPLPASSTLIESHAANAQQQKHIQDAVFNAAPAAGHVIIMIHSLKSCSNPRARSPPAPSHHQLIATPPVN